MTPRTPSGTLPAQPGGTISHSPSPVPVARRPTYAKLSVQASTNWST